MVFSDMVTDIYQTGKDIFLHREGLKDYQERQASNIEGRKVVIEAESQAAVAESKVKMSTVAYIGAGLLALAIFVNVFKSIR